MAEKGSGAFAQRVKALRAGSPLFDHVMLMQDHYTKVQGSVLASSVTYFGFLSFFPILALGFAVVGFVSIGWPEARDSMITAIQQVLPGIVSSDGESGTISLSSIEDSKAAAGLIGFAGVLYSGLGWVSGLRSALQTVFMLPPAKKQNFILGKAIDLVALACIGFILLVSVASAGVVKAAADDILVAVGLDDTWIGRPLLWAIGIVLGLAASTLLFFVTYRLLGMPSVNAIPLWQGAFLGAAGFEVLKLLVVNVFGQVGGSAFAPLAIAITLVVWINYFSRLVVYGASWAMTSPAAGTDRASLKSEVAAVADVGDPVPATTAAEPARGGRFDAGSAVIGALAGAAAAAIFGRRP